MNKYELTNTHVIEAGTESYDVCADYPVDCMEFFTEMLTREDSPLVTIHAVNETYGGYTQNGIVIERNHKTGKWSLIASEPKSLLEKFAIEKMIACRVEKWWGHTSYYVTFEEN